MEEADDEGREELEELDKDGSVPSGWERSYYRDRWEFVTACFTEQGCKDYIAANGHNLTEPRIYAYGSYRNNEFRAVRSALTGMAGTSKRPTKSPTC